MRLCTESCINLIKGFESLALKIYRCPSGYETVGYGHLVRKNERHLFQQGIDETTAFKLLAHDVRAAELAVSALINVPLSDGQFDSLVSFIFNLGSGAFQRSTLRALVNRQEHEYVPDEFMRWVWAGGKKLRGLILRRAAEGQLYQQ